VEPERFDDVAFRMVESPEPPRRPPRGRRWVLALVACVLTTGALAAGASALTGGDDDQRATAPAKPRTNVSYTESGVPFVHEGRGCKAGESLGHHGKREKRSSDPRY
jgi:hypothetical protein